MLEQNVKVYYCKIKDKTKKPSFTNGHLLYVIDDKIIVETTTSGTVIFEKDKKIWSELLKLYFIIGMVSFNVETDKKPKCYLKPLIFNCISFGKQLLGVKGIYFTPKQFFNKLWELKRKRSK